MSTFGERFKTLREREKLSQTKLAECLEVSVSTIRMLEKNERKPSVKLLTKISNLFFITADDLLYGERKLKSLKIDSQGTVEEYEDPIEVIPSDILKNTDPYELTEMFWEKFYPLSVTKANKDFAKDKNFGNLTHSLLVEIVAQDLVFSEDNVSEKIMELIIATVKIDLATLLKSKDQDFKKDPDKYLD